MEYMSTMNEQAWINFGDPLNEEKAVQFMMEHFGFANTDHLSDDECEELMYKCELIWLSEEYNRSSDLDFDDPNSYDEYGRLKARPATEYGMMIGGMSAYICGQFHEGGSRYRG